MITERERQLLDWIAENPLISQQELADKAGITRSSVAVHISNLMKKGYITGKGYIVRTAPYVVVVGGVNMDIGGRPHGELVAVRGLIDRNLLHHGLVALAVRRGGGDVHVLRVALRHVLHGGVEPGDHLAGHAGELDGLAAIDGGVELRAVVEGARVVDLDLLAFVAHQELLSRECNAHQSTRAVRAFPFAARNLLQVATSP